MPFFWLISVAERMLINAQVEYRKMRDPLARPRNLSSAMPKSRSPRYRRCVAAPIKPS
jgi:hypothetical protein